MKSSFLPCVLMLLVLLSACDEVPVVDAPPAEVVILQSWSGDYPVVELQRLPASRQQFAVGYLGTAAEFEAVWSIFKPGEPVPAVDFGRHIVVFHRNVDFYNQTRIFKATLEGGVLNVLAMETRSALPIEDKVAMALAVVPRQGVRFIQAGTTRVPVTAE
jgi:hypothetical protein